MLDTFIHRVLYLHYTRLSRSYSSFPTVHLWRCEGCSQIISSGPHSRLLPRDCPVPFCLQDHIRLAVSIALRWNELIPRNFAVATLASGHSLDIWIYHSYIWFTPKSDCCPVESGAGGEVKSMNSSIRPPCCSISLYCGSSKGCVALSTSG